MLIHMLIGRAGKSCSVHSLGWILCTCARTLRFLRLSNRRRETHITYQYPDPLCTKQQIFTKVVGSLSYFRGRLGWTARLQLTENLSSSKAISCMASIESRPKAPSGASCFVEQSAITHEKRTEMVEHYELRKTSGCVSRKPGELERGWSNREQVQDAAIHID